MTPTKPLIYKNNGILFTQHTLNLIKKHPKIIIPSIISTIINIVLAIAIYHPLIHHATIDIKNNPNISIYYLLAFYILLAVYLYCRNFINSIFMATAIAQIMNINKDQSLLSIKKSIHQVRPILKSLFRLNNTALSLGRFSRITPYFLRKKKWVKERSDLFSSRFSLILVKPCIVKQHLHYKKALTRSKELFIETWGDASFTNYNKLGLMTMEILLMLATIIFSITLNFKYSVHVCIAMLILIYIVFSTIKKTIRVIICNELYDYATTKKTKTGLIEPALKTAFVIRYTKRTDKNTAN